MPWPNAKHYRKRAEELRAAARHMTDEEAKENLLDLAREYEAMAEKRAGNGAEKGSSEPP